MPLNWDVGPTPGLNDVTLDTVETRLEAINLCLRAVGYASVETEDSGDLDAADASKILATVSSRVQYNGGKGWWFNVEPNWEMTPDANGEILIPNNAISAWQDVQRDELKASITIRGRKVYSLMRHSTDMRPHLNNSGFFRMVFMLNLPYEHIPISARQAIAYQAAVEFMVSKDFDPQKIQVWQQLAQSLLLDMGQEQANQKSLNMFVNNPTQSYFGAVVSGPNARPGFSRNPWNGYGGWHRNGGR